MSDSKKNVTKQLILETTLTLIDEHDGIKGVSLREIAKKAGCAHTNLYNFFDSLDDIFWTALGEALLKMMDYPQKKIYIEGTKEEKINLFLSSLIDFLIEHPGWYRLIWLEHLGGAPSKEVIEILHMPGEEARKLLIKASNNKLSEERAEFIGNILHGYMHGEICKWITNRSFSPQKQEIKQKILVNLRCLYQLLISQEEA